MQSVLFHEFIHKLDDARTDSGVDRWNKAHQVDTNKMTKGQLKTWFKSRRKIAKKGQGQGEYFQQPFEQNAYFQQSLQKALWAGASSAKNPQEFSDLVIKSYNPDAIANMSPEIIRKIKKRAATTWQYLKNKNTGVPKS